MKYYKNWYAWYMDNEAQEEYKNLYLARQEIYEKMFERERQEELERLYNNVGNDTAAFANDIVEGITVKDNKIVFNGEFKKTKTYSMSFVERLGRELGKELGKIPGILLDPGTDKRKRK